MKAIALSIASLLFVAKIILWPVWDQPEPPAWWGRIEGALS